MEKLKLPANPQDLLNLYSLRDQLRIKEELEKNIESYIWDYVKSFFMTSDEVLKYIPESKYNEYHIYRMNGTLIPEGLDICNKDFKFANESTKIYYIIEHKSKTIIPFGPLYEREHGTENVMINGNKISGRTFLESYKTTGYMEDLEVCVSTSAKLYYPLLNVGTPFELGRYTTQFYKEVNISFNMANNSIRYVDLWRTRKEGFDLFSEEREHYRRLSM